MTRYRWHIVGHLPLLERLEKDIETDGLSHSYIFAGPPQIGKHSVALTLAHILQCEQGYCYDCTTCSQISKGIHSETIEFRDDGEELGIDAIRDLLNRLYLTPSARYKIVIIERAERMTTAAANCLLKMLEEPPPQTLFILTTDNIRELLPTVISRSRTLHFQTCSNTELLDFLSLEYMDREPRTLELACELSLGRPGVAFKILEDPDMMEFYTMLYRDINRFFAFNNIFERFAYLQDLVEDSHKIGIFLDIFTHLARKKMIEGGSGTQSDTSCLGTGTDARYLALLDKIVASKTALRQHVNPRLLLENIMLSF